MEDHKRLVSGIIALKGIYEYDALVYASRAVDTGTFRPYAELCQAFADQLRTLLADSGYDAEVVDGG